MALKLSSPWMIWYRKVSTFFKGDSDIRVVFDENTYELNLYVENADKADALGQIMPTEKTFGNITVKISVIPANVPTTALKLNRANLYERALAGNSALSFIKIVSGIMTNDLVYVVFKKEVVQYFTDDLGDYFGQCSTLYQNMAEDIFEVQDGVCFCTDKNTSDLITFNKLYTTATCTCN